MSFAIDKKVGEPLNLQTPTDQKLYPLGIKSRWIWDPQYLANIGTGSKTYVFPI